ncbi:hypothetical protein AG1IA_07860 [Rhizoctonia solani AG-1 IA]|uniref:Uncharacterized protein n=1 Tax=Thanatephorus cucumeris (strain AG1-IA) TaxID=983506 RepID=L8WJK8_THACA|nr:hypothetical protein AG1IA_07860 [Rhizoctonia solani AG-1 IA]
MLAGTSFKCVRTKTWGRSWSRSDGCNGRWVLLRSLLQIGLCAGGFFNFGGTRGRAGDNRRADGWYRVRYRSR